MRPRFRSKSGPNPNRDGRNLELVRVRGTQRDSGRAPRNVGGRARRRGGRGSRPTAAPAPPRRPSFWRWLKALFAPPPAPGAARGAGRAPIEGQEARVIADFCKHYGLVFRDPALLKLALTHRSYLHVTGERDSNERLEFLGDSVLGLVTSENLYRAHPTEHEGQLTKTKSLLVSKAILSRRALAMGLGRFVLMSHSEVESGGRQRLSILADAFESVVGAIYLDQGFEAARAFIERWLLRDTRAIVADKRHTNYKSHLQEYVQSTYRTHPVYRIRSEMGPDHSKQFMVEVIVGRRTLGEGKGRNKKEAEQAAARDALERVENGPSSDRALESEGRRSEARERQVPERRAPERTVAARASEPADEDGERESTVALPGHGSEEREVLSRRRRRRGRRGGRGRRRDGGDADRPSAPDRGGPAGAAPPEAGAPTPTAPPSPPPPPRPPLAPAAPARTSREPGRAFSSFVPSAPMPPAPEPPPMELEPRPRAHEEDDNEEVGRPEGPSGASRMESDFWERDTRMTPPIGWSEPSGAEPEAQAEEVAPLAENGTSLRAGATGGEDQAEDADDAPPPAPPGETEPAEAAEPPPAPPTVSYGRRPGRAKRPVG